jgi:hypothetical protein
MGELTRVLAISRIRDLRGASSDLVLRLTYQPDRLCRHKAQARLILTPY